MAFPGWHPSDIIAGDTGTGTTFPVTLATNRAVGDLLLIVGCSNNSGAYIAPQPPDTRVVSVPANWTDKGSARQQGSLTEMFIFARVCDGSESSPLTVTKQTSGVVSWASMRVSAWSGNLADVDYTNASLFSSSNIDPPSNTAAWGSADNLFIALAAKHAGAAPQDYPDNYTNFEYRVNAGVSGPIAWAMRNVAGATDDPTAFDMPGGVGQTLIVRPYAGDVQAPTVPTGLAAGAATHNTLAWSWEASTDQGGGTVVGYKVQVTLANDTPFGSPVDVTSGLSYTAQGIGLFPGTQYKLKVLAYDDAIPRNESAYCTAVANTTKHVQLTFEVRDTNGGLLMNQTGLLWEAGYGNVGEDMTWEDGGSTATTDASGICTVNVLTIAGVAGSTEYTVVVKKAGEGNPVYGVQEGIVLTAET